MTKDTETHDNIDQIWSNDHFRERSGSNRGRVGELLWPGPCDDEGITKTSQLQVFLLFSLGV